MVCNGPFLLKEWSPGSRVVVDRNPNYWDARHVRLNRMVFYPIENASTQEAAFRAGQLHLTSDVPLSKIASYRRDHPAVLRIDPFLDTAFLRFNTGRKPFTDPRVRQALARALDRTAHGPRRYAWRPATGALPDPAGHSGVHSPRRDTRRFRGRTPVAR